MGSFVPHSLRHTTRFLPLMVLLLLPSRMVIHAWVPRQGRASTVCRYLTSSSIHSAPEDSQSNSQYHSQYHNPNNIRDQIFSAISKDGGIKVTACTVRNMVNDMSLQHNLSGLTTDIMGRTVACALLMANGIQAEQIVQITINCT